MVNYLNGGRKVLFPPFKNILINHPNTTITNFSLKKEKEKKKRTIITYRNS